MDIISVKHTDNLTNPNGQATGGSITTECVGLALIQCCTILNQRLDPIRKQMPSGYSWADLIAKAFSLGVDLCVRYWNFPQPKNPFDYEVYGAAVCEAQIDVLTGETMITRTDILYDCGQT
jgi:CO/xanthine dehydrogenase Mo-binding subunit